MIDIQALLKERGRGRPIGQPQSLKTHLKRHMDGPVYIAMEDADFTWSKEALQELVDMWKTGVPIDYMASNFDRQDEEVAIVLMDLAMHGVIQPRQGGVWGKGA